MTNDRFDDLCRRYRTRLVNMLRYDCGRSLDDANDLAHEVLVKTWKHLGNVQPGAEWGYLRTAARRLAIDHVMNEHPQVPLDEIEPPQSGDSAESDLILRQERERFEVDFRAAYLELPLLTQQCIALNRNHTYKETAAKLGLTFDQVQSRIKRGAKHLRETLGPPPPGVEWLPGDDES